MKKVKYIIGVVALVIVSISLIFLFKNNKDDIVKGDIVIWANSNNFDYLNESANKFMEANDRAKINIIKVQSYEYESKLSEAVNKGNLPNIVQFESGSLASTVIKYKDKVSIEQEKSIIETYSSNFTKGRVAEVSSQDKGLLGTPFTSRPLVLYLRQDMMDPYGYNHQNISSWDQLISMGRDIYEKSNGKIKILNGTGQDYDDLVSLLVMQAMEEFNNEADIVSDVRTKISLLENENILNLKDGGEFLGKITSINGVRELRALDEECRWTANNVPSRSKGSNRFYVEEGDNLVVTSKNDENSELIRRFIGFLSTNTQDSIQYIKEGRFFLSSLSTYKEREIEEPIKNFEGKSPLVIMANITEKAPEIKNYKLYREIKNDFLNK